ncbi:hypothetical protein EW146_g1298 [Bondarzewia mesenterica]|uniref:Protein PNS1 n=1 Tax=Bondarzewia mesenterica TaxID=1095465 RepID=A0A4S4M647_9AGAM|nr:hypothetical protein EW146_g1298 [Bondarzewia mesenterica]
MSQYQQWGSHPPQSQSPAGYQPVYAPGQSEPYAQSYYPPVVSENQGYGSDPKSPFEGDRFKPRKAINDPIFLILFIAQFAGYCVLSSIVLSSWVSNDGLGGGVGNGNTGTSITLNRHTVYLLLFVCGSGLLLSTIYLLLTRAFTRLIMHFTLILSILLNIGICIYYWITRYYSGAIIFTVIALLSIFSYFGFRSRIPLASLLLQVVMDISKHHKSVYFMAFVGLLIQAAMSVWYSFTVIAHALREQFCSSSKVAGLVFYATFSYIWTSMTWGNVVIVTLAGGPFGSWYYFGPREQGTMPKHPTITSFIRASTLSLGSVAFGSLIVTVLEIIRLILQNVRNNANADGHPVEVIFACCAECFIGCIEWMVQYFNRYAYIEIALYGKTYIAAAKDTWRLFKDRGIDALVNDSLVSMTLTWGAYAVGLMCSLFGYLYLRYTHPSYNSDGQYTAPILLFSFLIGAQLRKYQATCVPFTENLIKIRWIVLTLASAIEAGVSTIFVGLGEDPGVLAIRAPELFGMIADRYPRVVDGVARV